MTMTKMTMTKMTSLSLYFPRKSWMDFSLTLPWIECLLCTLILIPGRSWIILSKPLFLLNRLRGKPLSFPDVVDSRFPELVDNLLETLTPLLKRLSFVFRCYKICKKKIFFAKTFENRNAAAVPLQRQSERRKFALLQEKNYGPTGEQKFQSKCDTREI